jgi:hypothetical protein
MNAEGWQYILGARKCHYFKADGRSLCGTWLNLGSGENRTPDHGWMSSDDCVGCRKKLPKREDGGIKP